MFRTREFMFRKTAVCFVIPYRCFSFAELLLYIHVLVYFLCLLDSDRLCGLVVRVSGYRYRGPGFDPRRYQIF